MIKFERKKKENNNNDLIVNYREKIGTILI